MSIAEIENEIIEELELFGDDWEGKYEHVIELGKSLPKIKDEYKTEDRIIKGCHRKLWLHAQKEGNSIVDRAHSDDIITKGMVALMIRVLSHQKPQDIV